MADKIPVYEQLLHILSSSPYKNFEYRMSEKAFVEAKLNCLLGRFENALEVL